MSKLKLTLSLSLIIIIVLAAFSPCLKNGFVNWDDEYYVVNNASITSVSASNLKTILTSFSVGHYQPLTILSYLLDHQFYKLNPFGYHLTNLILHLLNSLLVFYLIYLLSRNIGISFLTAILFGIHPLHVESVAWVSERKDVLYSFFYLLSIITYLYYLTKENRSKYYLLSLFLFLCSLLSKSMAVTLPLILLLMDYYLKRKPNKQLILDKIPYFILALITGTIVIISLIFLGGARQESHYGLLSALFVTSYSLVFYLGKLFLPIKLSCLYPYYNFVYNPAYLYSIITIMLLALFMALSVKYTRKLFFGALLFLITLLPVIQFIPSSAMIVADRYTYIPSIGIFFIIATLIYWIYNKKLKIVALVVTALIITSLTFLTYNRCKVWKDGVTLWNDAIINHDNSSMPLAYSNRAAAYTKQQEYYLATADFYKSLGIYHSLFGLKKDYETAYIKLLTSGHDYSGIYNFLGVQFARINCKAEAKFLFNNSIMLNPRNVQAYSNLVALLGDLREYKKAIALGKVAISIDPNSAALYYNMSMAYYFDHQYELMNQYMRSAEKLGYKIPPDSLQLIISYNKDTLPNRQ